MGASFTAMDRSAAPVSERSRQPLARRLLIDLSIMTVIGVFLAVIGPFGSMQDPFAVRLVVWLGLAYAGYMIYRPVGWFVDRMHASLDLPRIGLWVAGTLIATVPMTIVVWSLNQLNQPYYRLPAAPDALLQYTYVLVIGGAVTLLFNVIQFREDEPPLNEESQFDAGDADAPRLADRLPPALGSDIIALEMEDHYVRVHTALGSELVLMRLRDAMGELDGVEGRQVHRSWWVARGAVEDVIRDGRNVRLKLARDLVAPVSRAQVSELKQAGWL